MNAIHNREEFFTSLYKKAFPSVAKYISHRGGSFDEAKDVFHDALVIFYEKAVTSDINETAYLVGIAKHLWLKKSNQGSIDTPLGDLDMPVAENEEQPSTHRIIHFLEKAGSKCMELLKSFYYDQLPLNEIAETFGFSGIRSATVQKYKCLGKVREIIKQKALQYEDFME